LAFATGMMAVATFTLATLTYLNISRSDAQGKIERTERRLKEIVEWATDILSCEIERDIAYVEEMKGARQYTDDEARDKRMDWIMASRLKHMYRTISNRGVYISEIAHKFFGPELQATVERTLVRLYRIDKILDLAQAGKIKNWNSIGKYRTILDMSTEEIIRLAVKIL